MTAIDFMKDCDSCDFGKENWRANKSIRDFTNNFFVAEERV